MIKNNTSQEITQKKYKNNNEGDIFFDEFQREFWRKIIYEAIELALKVNQDPLISRKEALRIIPRRSLDNGVKNGELRKIRHGRVYFDRIQFHKYIMR